ncbi:hypothetical protein [uncultured Alistipes sp.]|jgi:hypothetical protein|uniref:hypothetical protein n=1 Tax=uncultured Alistipes sp. TaxID=538949 RepID=UPI0026342CEA|nr:hypothetical protein [uncultured Alistipes sp.]
MKKLLRLMSAARLHALKSGPVLLEPLAGDPDKKRNDIYNFDSYLEIITYSRF